MSSWFPYPQKITFGEMSDSGVREILFYCRDQRCSNDADGWADDMRLPDLEQKFTRRACGHHGPMLALM